MTCKPQFWSRFRPTFRPNLRSLAQPAPTHAVVAACLAALATPSAQALQLIEARDGVTVEAVIATKEATRIRIENAPITDVFGNLYSSNCAPPAAAIVGTPSSTSPAVNPSGEIILECDRDKGEIYVRPAGTSSVSDKADKADKADQQAKAINLFVSSANATYTLLLRPSDTPSDTIVIRDRTAQRAGGYPSSERQGPLGTSANPIRAMKALLVAMASGEVAPDVRVEEVNRPIALWNEARFSLMRTYEARNLVGEKYLLINTSNQTMVLTEQEFDRASGHIVGISIENMNLRPGESTGVYVIRLSHVEDRLKDSLERRP
jgi:conjugal transfer pilus assembly protein TraK